jgi:hypothetical protein
VYLGLSAASARTRATLPGDDCVSLGLLSSSSSAQQSLVSLWLRLLDGEPASRAAASLEWPVVMPGGAVIRLPMVIARSIPCILAEARSRS